MRALKPFLPSLYSEYLLTNPSNANQQGDFVLESPVNEKAPGLPEGEGDLRGPGGEGRGTYQRGLGETFGFPGDARKMRERSKMKLWREYFTGQLSLQSGRKTLTSPVHGRNLTCKLSDHLSETS